MVYDGMGSFDIWMMGRECWNELPHHYQDGDGWLCTTAEKERRGMRVLVQNKTEEEEIKKKKMRVKYLETETKKK